MANRQVVEDHIIEEDEINLLDYWRVIVKQKVLCLVAIIASVTTPRRYR